MTRTTTPSAADSARNRPKNAETPRKRARKRDQGPREPWPQGQPLYRSPDPSHVPGAWFDQAAVDRVIRALRALRHTKGKWAGAPLEPEPWQIAHVIAPIFGWKGADGRRIVRTAWIEIPRKNGKSTLAAGLALVLLAADGEAGAEVYSAAASKDQARVVFDEAQRMASRAPALRKVARVLSSAIVVPKTASTYKVLSSLGEVAHGKNVHAAIVDEVHVHANGKLIEALETGTGAREQPLILFITTADEGESGGPYAERHDYAVKVATGVIDDPSFYAAIWAAADDDDPFAEETWRKANPNLGVSVSIETLRNEAKKARSSAVFFASYCRLYLNRRVRVAKRWLPLADWDASAGVVDLERLRGRVCYAGLDLASTTDLAALVLAFPVEDDVIEVVPFFWAPAETIGERSAKVPYQGWADGGFVETTSGNVIDYKAIRQRIEELADIYDVREWGYDPWNATQLAVELQDDVGLPMVQIRQGYGSLSAPTKELMRLTLGKKLRHGGHPVLRWMADNLVLKTDPAGNVKPDKEKSSEKIDGMVALIMAIDGVMRNGDGQSVYEDRGLLVI